MEDTYSFVASADELKKYSDLQDIVKRILKQTIQCGYFIQQYAQRDFGGKGNFISGAMRNLSNIEQGGQSHRPPLAWIAR
jgi:hypothetical protein